MRTRKTGLGTVALAALVASAILPSTAQATTTRIYTLGAMNRFIIDDTNRWLYPHMITKFGNLFYIELFGATPSQGASAPTGSNRLTAIAGNGGPTIHSLDIADTVPVQMTAGGGAIIGITDDLFVGLHLSDYENPAIPQLLTFLSASATGGGGINGYPWLAPVAPDAPSSANRKYDLFLAYNLQDLARFGLLFTYGSSKYTRTPNDNDPQVTYANGATENRLSDNIRSGELGFLLGGGLDIGDSAAVDVGLGMTFHSLTYEPNQRSDLIDGGGGIQLNADIRAIIGVSEMWEVVPALSVRYGKLSAADLANFGTGLIFNDEDGREKYFITDVSLSRFIFDLGVAGHFKPTETISFWGGAGFHFINVAQTYRNSIADQPDVGEARDQAYEFSRDSVAIDAMPYMRLAMEARIFFWLDFRAGVVKYLRADTLVEDRINMNPVPDDPNANRLNDITRDFPFFDYFIGFGAHYEGFFCDLQIDPSWFTRGPEILSGGGAGNPMFINASLGYHF